ncbi:FlgO family outer membrane protein [uncultured Psychrosphaera sp.]|jgi:TolB-like protein|uniref:FlgO family outer membrane protein n=1 Tax=uncultured Psychrosphaera sp. TaxID=1403522 RepID=UPI002601F8F1|nr:FlgO family outer membrane protein [uncultured Psychrosphaera sp.]
MNKLLIPLLFSTILSGCMTMGSEEANNSAVDPQSVNNGSANRMNSQGQNSNSAVNFQDSYRNKLLSNMGNAYQRRGNRSQSIKDVNYYVRGLMQELVGNLQYVNASTPVAVTNFVFLDGSFENSDLVGKQLSESFIHEVHKFGIPVLDFKTTDYIRVSQSGDFVLSRDFLELNSDLPIRYVVAGTLVRHLAGYMVNARIVGIDSKAVVASAQGFIPASVINSLISGSINDGIPLTSN